MTAGKLWCFHRIALLLYRANWFTTRPPRPHQTVVGNWLIASALLNQVDTLVVKMLAGGPTVEKLQRSMTSGPRRIIDTMDGSLDLDVALFLDGSLENGSDLDLALFIARAYGQVDRELHKEWVIDQMVRALLGPDYLKFVLDYEAEMQCEWRTGIAP